MEELRQSTAITLKIGPFLDDTDGKTAETGLTITQAEVRLSKNGGNIAQKNEGANCTHDELGVYGCPIDTTDTNTLGRFQLWVHESGALPVWHEYMVMTANAWDSKYSTDKLEVDVIQIGGVAQSATDLKDLVDTGYDPATHKVQGVVLVDTTTTNTDMVGTDSAALAAVCTEARLAELAAANLPADVDTLIGRVTAAVALASVCTEARLAELAAANLPTDVDAIKAKTDLLPSGVPKNVALSNFEFLMVLSGDHYTPATGKTLTEEISKDGGAFVACTNAAAEVGSGVYKIDLTQAEMNADVIVLKFTEADCDQRTVTILTST